MKKHNPHTPIMIREASNVEPKVYARFGAFVPFQFSTVANKSEETAAWKLSRGDI